MLRILIAFTLFISVGVVVGQSPFDEVRGKKEDITKRDLFSKHYINDDGGYTALIGAGPIHYKKDGQFLDIDHTIVPHSSSSYPFTNRTNLMESYFGATSHEGIKSVTVEGQVKEFLNTKMYWEVGGEAVSVYTSANTAIQIEGDKAIYPQLFGEISAEYQVLTGKRELNYLIPTADALQNIPTDANYLVFSEDIELPIGWTSSITDRGVLIKNQVGEEMYLYENPHSTDAETMALREENTIFGVKHVGNVLTIETKVKTEWLLSEDRVFPVKVDPTVTVTPNNQYNWTGEAWDDAIMLEDEIFVGRYNFAFYHYGWYNDIHWAAGYSRFNLSSIANNSSVTSAAGYINITSGSGVNITTRTWAFVNSADPLTFTGNLFNSMETAFSQSVPIESLGWRSSTFASGGITALENSINNDFISLGIYPMGTWQVYNNQENGTFFTADGYSSNNRPYLSITYTVPSNCSAGAATGPSYIQTDNTANLTLSDYTGTNIQWQTSPNGSTGWTDVTTGTGENTANYTTANLPDGTYYFRAKVTDGASCIEYSNVITINVSYYCSGQGNGNTYLNNHIESIKFHEWVDPTVGGTNNYVSNSYLDYSDTNIYGYPLVVAGQYHHFNVSLRANGIGSNGTTFAYWIDWNGNGVFESSERMDNLFYTSNVGNTYAGYFTVPQDAPETVRIRVRAVRGNQGTLNPCTAYVNSQTKDFTIRVLPSIGPQTCLGVNGKADNVNANSTDDKVYIQRVEVKGQQEGTIIDNNSLYFGVQTGAQFTLYNYSNFMGVASQGLVMTAGREYTVTIEHSGYTTAAGLFIDWNGNGEFDDDDELVGRLSDPNTNPFVFTFTAPSFIEDGKQVVMRVRLRYDDLGNLENTINACDNINDGFAQYSEVEDYRVTLRTSPLPVELTDFSISCHDTPIVRWTTASETDSVSFLVQYSSNGTDWRDLATVPGAGNKNTTTHYEVDGVSSSGILYYRLIQRDFDGKSKIYGPISADCASNSNDWKIYPNPNSGTFIVEVNSLSDEEGVLVILDAQGRTIYQKEVVVKKGSNLFPVSESISKGIYLISLKNEKKNYKTIKFIAH